MAYLMNIQPFSVNDGEGIRTTIFLAGCPLHCKWCSNPEGLHQSPVIGFYESSCIGCGACTESCPINIGIDLNSERSKCISCGACVSVCPKNARKWLVRCVDESDILSAANKDALFYRNSGGGITFSGGEATSQFEVLDYLSQRLYDMGYSLDLETSGYFDFDKMLPILERMDLIFMDLKHMDSASHRAFTGIPNDLILNNMKRLPETGARIVIRIPVIEGVNADFDNIRSSGEFVMKYLPDAEMELLPYHNLGISKYEALGISYSNDNFETPTEAKMHELKRILEDIGVKLVDFK